MNAITDTGTRPRAGEPDGGRPDRVRLAAYVRDRATEAVLQEALGDLLTPRDTIRRADHAGMRRGLQTEPTPGTLILDVSGEAQPLLMLDDLAQYVEPGVRVLVIGDTLELDFYRLVTRSLGVLEYLPKPLNREMVGRHFRPYILGEDRVGTQLRAGRVVTVTGVRGGTGATTIAANLAIYLGEVTHRHTLLIDADLHAGTAALMLSAESGGALRTALEHPERVDDVFLQRAARAVGDRLHVLCAEEGLDRLEQIRPEAVGDLLQILRRHYNFIVVDVPSHATPFNRAFLDMADQHVLVMDGSLAAIRDTLRFLALPAAAAQSRPPVLVMNHVGHPGMLPRKQVIAKLGQEPEVSIPHMPKALGYAATLGEPASRRRRGVLRSAIARLSQEITTTTNTPAKTERTGLLDRLLGR